jgi:hypothetical protein
VSWTTFWHLPSTPHYCWSAVILISSLGSRSERDQCCKEGSQTTPSWNAPAVLECELVYADAHYHGAALHRISPFQDFCSEWPYAVFKAAVHLCHYCGPLLHEFHHQQSFSVPENSYLQLSGRQTTFISTFSACMVNVYASTALTGLNIHKLNPGFITCYSYDLID